MNKSYSASKSKYGDGPMHMAHQMIHPFIGMSLHETIIPPNPMPTPWPHIEFSFLPGVFFGCLPSMGHDNGRVDGPFGVPLMGRMSDAGVIVLHAPLVPASMPTPLLLLTILTSQSNSPVGSSSVNIPCHNWLWGDQICDLAVTSFPNTFMSLNLGCWDPIPLPTDLVFSPSTVVAGVTLADWLTAITDVALDMGMALIMSRYGRKLFKALAKKAKSLGSGIADMAKKVPMPNFSKMLTTLGDGASDQLAKLKKLFSDGGSGGGPGFFKKAGDELAAFAKKADSIIDDIDAGVKKLIISGGVTATVATAPYWVTRIVGKGLKGAGKLAGKGLKEAGGAMGKLGREFAELESTQKALKKLGKMCDEIDEVFKKMGREIDTWPATMSAWCHSASVKLDDMFTRLQHLPDLLDDFLDRKLYRLNSGPNANAILTKVEVQKRYIKGTLLKLGIGKLGKRSIYNELGMGPGDDPDKPGFKRRVAEWMAGDRASSAVVT